MSEIKDKSIRERIKSENQKKMLKVNSNNYILKDDLQRTR